MLPPAVIGSAFPAISSHLPSSIGILDSGCSTTTLKNKEYFTTVKKVDRKIQTADSDSNIAVQYVGPVPPFYEVNYLPNCHTNLISLSDLDDLGIQINISDGDLSCIHNGRVIFKCSKHESLWKVQVDALLQVLRETFGSQAAVDWVRNHKAGNGESYIASTVNKAEEFFYLWHLRTFHRNSQHLAKAILQRRIVIEGSESFDLKYDTKLSQNVCEPCAKSKSHAVPKPRATSQPPLKTSKRLSEKGSGVVTVKRSDKNREVRQYAKRVTAKKRNVEDFFYQIDLIFYDPDIDSECIVKNVLVRNGNIVAEYKRLKDGIEQGQLESIHVAEVEKLLGIHLSDEYEGEKDDTGSASSMQASALHDEISDSMTYADAGIPTRASQHPIRQATETEISGQRFPQYIESEYLSEKSPPERVKGRLESSESSYAARQCEVLGIDGFNTPAREDSACDWIEIPHVKGALYSFANEYIAYKDPVTYSEALNGGNSEQWREAIATEVNNIKDRGVVREVKRPPDLRNLIGCRFVFKTKMKHGKIDKFKARLVAKGFTQVKELDYNETFAPVARMNTLRIFLKLSVDLGHIRVSIDFVAAFLNSIVSEDLYMKAPDGWEIEPGNVLKLEKSLYGLKQSGRNWRNLIHEYLIKIEKFQVCLSEHCVYTKNGNEILLILYVDDMIISSKRKEDSDGLITRLKEQFDIGEEGPLNWYLGMAIDDKGTSIKLSQRDYVDKMLTKYHYEDMSTEETPMIEKYQIDKDPEDEFFHEFDIRSKIGSLMFASVCTRPDITFAVSYLARFTNHPSRQVCIAIIRVFRYLKGTADLGITIKKEDGARPLVYCDADYAGDTTDYKSTSGVLVMIGSTPVCWYSSKQTSTAQSTTDAEIVSMNLATKEIVWIRNLLKEMGIAIAQPTRLLCDNQSAIMLAHNPVFHKRTKHIMVKFRFLIENLEQEEAILEHIKSLLNLADGLTKSLGASLFKSHRNSINMR